MIDKNNYDSSKRTIELVNTIKEKSFIASLHRIIPLCMKTAKGKIILPGSIFSIFLNTFVLFPVVYFLWSEVYDYSNGISGLSKAALLTYVLAARLIATIDPDIGIGSSLRTGDIVFKLVRPVNYIYICIATALGNIFSQFIIGVLPAIVVCLLIFKAIPLFSVQVILFFLSLFLSLIVIVLLSLTVELLTFWTINDWGLLIIYSGISSILSGAIIPIEVFPKCISGVLNLLPFASTINTPLMFITRVVTFNYAFKIITLQLLWIIILFIIVNLLWKKAINKLVVLGG